MVTSQTELRKRDLNQMMLARLKRARQEVKEEPVEIDIETIKRNFAEEHKQRLTEEIEKVSDNLEYAQEMYNKTSGEASERWDEKVNLYQNQLSELQQSRQYTTGEYDIDQVISSAYGVAMGQQQREILEKQQVEEMQEKGYKPVYFGNIPTSAIVAYEKPIYEGTQQIQEQTEIQKALSSGDILGFSGITLTPQQLAKKRLFEKVGFIKETPDYGEYFKPVTKKGAEILEKYKSTILEEQLPKSYEQVEPLPAKKVRESVIETERTKYIIPQRVTVGSPMWASQVKLRTKPTSLFETFVIVPTEALGKTASAIDWLGEKAKTTTEKIFEAMPEKEFKEPIQLTLPYMQRGTAYDYKQLQITKTAPKGFFATTLPTVARYAPELAFWGYASPVAIASYGARGISSLYTKGVSAGTLFDIGAATAFGIASKLPKTKFKLIKTETKVMPKKPVIFDIPVLRTVTKKGVLERFFTAMEFEGIPIWTGEAKVALPVTVKRAVTIEKQSAFRQVFNLPAKVLSREKSLKVLERAGYTPEQAVQVLRTTKAKVPKITMFGEKTIFTPIKGESRYAMKSILRYEPIRKEYARGFKPYMQSVKLKGYEKNLFNLESLKTYQTISPKYYEKYFPERFFKSPEELPLFQERAFQEALSKELGKGKIKTTLEIKIPKVPIIETNLKSINPKLGGAYVPKEVKLYIEETLSKSLKKRTIKHELGHFTQTFLFGDQAGFFKDTKFISSITGEEYNQLFRKAEIHLRKKYFTEILKTGKIPYKKIEYIPEYLADMFTEKIAKSKIKITGGEGTLYDVDVVGKRISGRGLEKPYFQPSLSVFVEREPMVYFAEGKGVTSLKTKPTQEGLTLLQKYKLNQKEIQRQIAFMQPSLTPVQEAKQIAIEVPKTSLAQMQTPRTIVTLKSEQSVVPMEIQEVRTSQRVFAVEALKETQKLKPAQRTQVVEMLKPIQEQPVLEKLKTTPTTKLVEKLKSAQTEKLIQVQKIKNVFDKMQISKMKKGFTFKGKPPFTPPKSEPLTSSFKTTKAKQPIGKILEVFTRKKGKDIKVSEVPTLESAKRTLVKELAETLRASGFIQEKETGRKLTFNEVRFGFGYRQSKVEPFRVVQKKGLRLGTSSERKSIQSERKKSRRRVRWF